MNAQCPRCGNHTSQGSPEDYSGFLKDAEAGKLTLFCGYCGNPWTPSPEDQKIYARNLRERIAQTRSGQ
jgi:hypothetical protein